MAHEPEIEPLAQLLAHLDDPFADRSAILEAVGLDERTLGARIEAMTRQLGSGTAEASAKADRFAAAYGAERARIASARSGFAPPVDESPVPYAGETAELGLVADVTLPFLKGAIPLSPDALPSARRPRTKPSHREDPAGGTVELRDPAPRKSATPFQAPKPEPSDDEITAVPPKPKAPPRR